MVALTTFAEMVRTSIEAKADVIFSGRRAADGPAQDFQ